NVYGRPIEKEISKIIDCLDLNDLALIDGNDDLHLKAKDILKILVYYKILNRKAEQLALLSCSPEKNLSLRNYFFDHSRRQIRLPVVDRQCIIQTCQVERHLPNLVIIVLRAVEESAVHQLEWFHLSWHVISPMPHWNAFERGEQWPELEGVYAGAAIDSKLRPGTVSNDETAWFRLLCIGSVHSHQTASLFHFGKRTEKRQVKPLPPHLKGLLLTRVFILRCWRLCSTNNEVERAAKFCFNYTKEAVLGDIKGRFITPYVKSFVFVCPQVEWVKQQEVKKRTKRDWPPSELSTASPQQQSQQQQLLTRPMFPDPLYPQQCLALNQRPKKTKILPVYLRLADHVRRTIRCTFHRPDSRPSKTFLQDFFSRKTSHLIIAQLASSGKGLSTRFS
ncbi:unnamed protein product, partial [Nesidiocoris tenuis]